MREPLGLDDGRLLIAFSHTHAGANLSRSMRDHPGGDKIRPYFKRLIARCAEAGVEAIANLVPAWLTFGSGTCDGAQLHIPQMVTGTPSPAGARRKIFSDQGRSRVRSGLRSPPDLPC